MRLFSLLTRSLGSSLRVFSLVCATSLALGLGSAAQAASPSSTEGKSMSTTPRVKLHTNQGDITIELHHEKTTKTVTSYLTYDTADFYDGPIFHSIIKKFINNSHGVD